MSLNFKIIIFAKDKLVKTPLEFVRKSSKLPWNLLEIIENSLGIC